MLVVPTLETSQKQGNCQQDELHSDKGVASVVCQYWNGFICYHYLKEAGFHIGRQMDYELQSNVCFGSDVG